MEALSKMAGAIPPALSQLSCPGTEGSRPGDQDLIFSTHPYSSYRPHMLAISIFETAYSFSI